MHLWVEALGHTGIYSLYGMGALLFAKVAGDRHQMQDRLLKGLVRKKREFERDAVILNDQRLMGRIFEDDNLEDDTATEEENVEDHHMDEA